MLTMNAPVRGGEEIHSPSLLKNSRARTFPTARTVKITVYQYLAPRYEKTYTRHRMGLDIMSGIGLRFLGQIMSNKYRCTWVRQILLDVILGRSQG